MATPGVFIVTEDPSVAELVGDVVDSSASAAERWVCRDLDQVGAELERRPAAAVVVDIDAAPARMLAGLEPLVERFPGTKFIAVASEQRDEWMHQAMHAGARGFLLKHTMVSTLPGVLDRLVPAASDNGALPRSIVTVLSAGGGCGATTLAINLAHELRQLSGAPALLIDLDICYGSLATYLGVSAEHGIADVLAYGDRIDAHLVESTAVAYKDQLHVLISPASREAGWSCALDLSHLDRALRAARQAFVHTVIDAPRVPRNVAVQLAKASAITLLVLETKVGDVRTAQAQLAALSGAGIAPQRLLPVVSRYRGRRCGISLNEVRRALGVERLGCLSDDYRKAVASINVGRTLAEASPRSTLRRDIQKLAREIRGARAAMPAPGRSEP
jgi:pilus assembly protein CpaE